MQARVIVGDAVYPYYVYAERFVQLSRTTTPFELQWTQQMDEAQGQIAFELGRAPESGTFCVDNVSLVDLGPADTTAPTLGAPTWSTNPKPVTGLAVLTVSAADSGSGVAGGEYFLDTDHGAGNNIPMPVASGNLSASIGTGLAAGVYQIGVRAEDGVGNWSAPTYTMLVVYDAATSVGVVGKNKNDLVPKIANGDVLPGLLNSGQTDTVDLGFTVGYTSGVLDPHNDLMLTYSTGSLCNTPRASGCHSFIVSATTFSWMLIDQTNSSRSLFQGTASVTVDGVNTSNAFTVEGIDGDRRTPSTDDHVTVKVYAPGADINTAAPIYLVAGNLAKGSSVKIR
jgi:hypothetical protein